MILILSFSTGIALMRTFAPLRFWPAMAPLVSLGLTSAADAREFRATDIQEADHPTVQAILHMGQFVTERTQGRHTIKVFHSGQLGDEGQTIEQTLTGAIEINRVNVVEIGKIAPALNALALPFLFRSNDHLHKVIDGPVGEEILASLDAHGFVGLTFYDAGARSIYTTKAVRTLADLKGLQLRVLRSDLIYKMVKAFGAQPTSIPYRQIPTALSTRLIDGAENNWPSFMRSGHYKVAPFYTVTEHTRGPSVLIMSRRSWDALSAEDRRIFRGAARASALSMREAWRTLEEQSRKHAAEMGVTIISDINRGPLEEATRPLRDELRADPTLGPLIARIESAE